MLLDREEDKKMSEKINEINEIDKSNDEVCLGCGVSSEEKHKSGCPVLKHHMDKLKSRIMIEEGKMDMIRPSKVTKENIATKEMSREEMEIQNRELREKNGRLSVMLNVAACPANCDSQNINTDTGTIRCQFCHERSILLGNKE
jgi:hypothetical protein